LWRDERGAAFLEFLIVLYAWMLLLFGIIQCGLLAIAAFYVNYANFMALRTASVHYEYYEAGWMSASALRDKCEKAALKALAPLERYYWKKSASLFGSSTSEILNRIRFDYTTSGNLPSPDNSKPVYIHGRLTYHFHLIVPFVNQVIYAFGQDYTATPPDDSRVMKNVVGRIPPSRMTPTLRMQSRNNLNSDGGPARYHDMVIQRRWRYN